MTIRRWCGPGSTGCGRAQVRADHAEFVGGDLADQNGTLRPEPGDDRCVSCGNPARQNRRTAGGGLACHIGHVLDRHGQPAERAGIVACGQHRIGGICLGQGVGCDMGEGVQTRTGGDAVQHGLHQHA